MALYRLHKTEWEQQLRQSTDAWKAKMGKSAVEARVGVAAADRKRKCKQDDDLQNDVEGDEATQARRRQKGEGFPGGGKKGISSGLSVVVRRNRERVWADIPRKRRNEVASGSAGAKWWEDAVA